MAVARVGERPVWRSDVRREAVAQQLINEGQSLDSGSPLFRRVLDEVIDQRLLALEAERRGLDRTPEGQRRAAAARDRALGDMLVEQSVDRAVNDAAVQALYREQLRLSRRGEQLRARQIVLRSEPDAIAVRRLLDAGGAFDQLATERSIDAATRFNGGDLGYFAVSTMPPEYGQALAMAQAGQLVGPFVVDPRAGGQSTPTWVVLRVEDRRQQPAPTLQEARPQIRRFLSFDQISELVQTLRRSARIRYLIVLSPAPEEPMPAAPASPVVSPAPNGPPPAAASGASMPLPSPGTAAPAPSQR